MFGANRDCSCIGEAGVRLPSQSLDAQFIGRSVTVHRARESYMGAYCERAVRSSAFFCPKKTKN